MPKKPNNKDTLDELLAVASHKVLSKLITELTVLFPDVRRKCFDFLKSQSTVSKALAKRSEGEAILALWSELAPDLEELDMYGGGDYGTMDHVADLLDQIRERLESEKVDADHRRELLDLVLPFIKSGNAGMDDMLDDVAYAACYDDGDLRGLARAFEAMENEYKVGRARDIYRRLGDRDKYLELRKARMVYGLDYHDLATFYWESGEKEKALQVAEEGLHKARGRMNELRGFVAARARETGDRDKYMVLQFEQAADGLTFEKYQAFKKMCTSAEWASFEAKVLDSLRHAGKNDRLKIRMHRREYDEALAILIKGRYPMSTWDGDYVIKVAKKLEKRYPEEILKYYLTGLGNLNRNAQRKEYSRRAKVMIKVRHMLIDVLDDEARWEKFARKVKQDNLRRPAFQQEFADAVPGWSELN
ncbi:MAG: hypothetical protein PVH87_10060 [Desulfobacteraceae bacterium]|jgi:hypothetical protein